MLPTCVRACAWAHAPAGQLGTPAAAHRCHPHPRGGPVTGCPAARRLRYMVKQLETGEVNVEELKRNLEYAASLLEAVYIDETRCGQGAVG